MNGDKKTKILVVDDDRRNVKLMEASLSIAGYDLILAYNGQEGIDKAKKERPDLIILDIMMPGMSGSEVAEFLAKEVSTKNIPIIFLTAILTKDDMGGDSMKEIAGHRFIAKPIERQKLLDCIKEVLKYKNG